MKDKTTHPWVAAFAKFGPLYASLFAPASTLYDIPACTQPWYALNGQPLPDPGASLSLSGVSLALSIIANALLVVRFTVHAPKAWRWAILASTGCWILKTIIAIANLIVFGADRRNGPGYSYEEGFYCAILSVVLSGIISLILVAHTFLHNNDEPDSEILFNGRMMVISEICVFSLIALQALIFSQIEGWTFLTGIYFSVTALLTIGYGDYTPTKASTKVLLFPFAIGGIALLSNQIGIIVQVASKRKEARREEFYRKSAKYIEHYVDRRKRHLSAVKDGSAKGSEEPDMHGASKEGGSHPRGAFGLLRRLARRGVHRHENATSKGQNGDFLGVDDHAENITLKEEIVRLRRRAQEHESMGQLLDLAYSTATLVIFWVVGAVIYHFMEGWSIGDAFYYNGVTFLSIGFGDFSPSTPAGRVVFVIWALMAVPIMTNFVVTTIQAVVEKMSKLLAMFAREKREERQRISENYFVSHDEYLLSAYEALQDEPDHGKRRSSDASVMKGITQERDMEDGLSQEASLPSKPSDAPSLHNETASTQDDNDMLKHALSLAMYLEAQSRVLLVHSFRIGSPERLLLQADANVQHARMAEFGQRRPTWIDDLHRSIEQDDRLEKIKLYRTTYARFLVAGSRALHLQGDDRLAWERRLASSEKMNS